MPIVSRRTSGLKAEALLSCANSTTCLTEGLWKFGESELFGGATFRMLYQDQSASQRVHEVVAGGGGVGGGGEWRWWLLVVAVLVVVVVGGGWWWSWWRWC